MITHKARDYIALSSGEYSDYRFNGLYRALKDIDLADCAQRYYDETPRCDWDEERKNASDSGFGAWLISHEMVEEIAYDEVHCGLYGFELSDVIEAATTRARELAAQDSRIHSDKESFL